MLHRWAASRLRIPICERDARIASASARIRVLIFWKMTGMDQSVHEHEQGLHLTSMTAKTRQALFTCIGA